MNDSSVFDSVPDGHKFGRIQQRQPPGLLGGATQHPLQVRRMCSDVVRQVPQVRHIFGAFLSVLRSCLTIS